MTCWGYSPFCLRFQTNSQTQRFVVPILRRSTVWVFFWVKVILRPLNAITPEGQNDGWMWTVWIQQESLTFKILGWKTLNVVGTWCSTESWFGGSTQKYTLHIISILDNFDQFKYFVNKSTIFHTCSYFMFPEPFVKSLTRDVNDPRPLASL